MQSPMRSQGADGGRVVTRDEALKEFARVQSTNRAGGFPIDDAGMQPWEQSALVSRLLSGKAPLLFPPPTSFCQPWYEVIEEEGPFPVRLGGTTPSWGEPSPSGAVFLEFLIVNQCPWGVVGGNDAAALMSEHFDRLRTCNSRVDGAIIIDSIQACLARGPEWHVQFEPWPVYRVFLRRGKRQGYRRDVGAQSFSRSSFDGTNSTVTRTLINAARRESIGTGSSPSEMDWVEYECDVWVLERTRAEHQRSDESARQ